MHDRGMDPREHLRVLTIGCALRSDCSVTVALLRSADAGLRRAYFAGVGLGCAFGFAKQALPDEAFDRPVTSDGKARSRKPPSLRGDKVWSKEASPEKGDTRAGLQIPFKI